jgi:hypothetical protein
MANLLYTSALVAALASSAALASDQAPSPQPATQYDQAAPAQPPPSQYDRATPQEGKMKLSKADEEEFVGLDKNKDGKLTPEEIANNPLREHFAMLDTDNDGSLSKAEFAKRHAMR